MNTEEVTPIYGGEELERAKTQLSEIRFDCILRMYDFGQIAVESDFVTRKPLPPQWFALSHKFSLEFIRDADEYTIGRTIKEAYRKLEDRIKEYETNRI